MDTLKSIEKIVRKAVLDGCVFLENRVDGVYIGDKQDLLKKIVHHSLSHFVAFATLPNLIPAYSNDILSEMQKLHISNSNSYICNINECDRNMLLYTLVSLEYVEWMFVFSKNVDLLCYTNDNHEDVTFGLLMIDG